MKTFIILLQAMPLRSLTQLLFIVVSTIITAVSCKKPFSNSNSATNITDIVADQAFGAIVASDHFTWATSKLITLNITALSQDIFEKNALIVKTENNEVVLIENIGINENQQQQITVPANTTQLSINYGTINKTISIVNNIATLDFTTPIPSQYQ
jgi:hypothetical protein